MKFHKNNNCARARFVRVRINNNAMDKVIKDHTERMIEAHEISEFFRELYHCRLVRYSDGVCCFYENGFDCRDCAFECLHRQSFDDSD